MRGRRITMHVIEEALMVRLGWGRSQQEVARWRAFSVGMVNQPRHQRRPWARPSCCRRNWTRGCCTSACAGARRRGALDFATMRMQPSLRKILT